jgi:hypothetical protein
MRMSANRNWRPPPRYPAANPRDETLSMVSVVLMWGSRLS